MKYLTFLLTVILLLVGVSGVMAQEDAGIAAVTIQATADGLAVPEGISPGPTTITFENQTDAPVVASAGRLHPDVTREQLIEALQQGPGAAIRLVTLMGAPLVLPQSTTEITYELEAGTHILLNLAAQPPQMAFFEVTGSAPEDVIEMEVDQTVSMVDFAFTAPIVMEAGEQTWLVENHGEQWHELAIARIDDDTDIGALQERILEAASQAGEGEAPMGPQVFLTPIDAGQRVWMHLDLEPGTYLLHCFLPDLLGTGETHARHGMVQVITVE